MHSIVTFEPILLASSSPRRIETLQRLGFPIIVCAPDVDESVFDHLPVNERVAALAELKAREGASRGPYPPIWAVGADTLVTVDGAAFGKPADQAEARSMLEALSGRSHIVSSGICALDRRTGAVELEVSETSVRFAPLSRTEIDWYASLGEWRGAAGAYRIQESAALFVERVEGSYSGVVGLPLHALYAILSRLGYPFPYGEASGSTVERRS
ncbi:MAG: septum formation protein Maf [Spirochaetes bacterium]|nr:septum formation protein Maf [Spirochaetota bacterium]MBU1081350.1 septum formation protein Maf [Spirochaetota bacterium]